MYKLKTFIRELHSFLILWSTQSLSSLGSSMTGFALIIWSYQQQGSALSTALLSVCSYTPYILMAIFAGALSDSWNKKITMLGQRYLRGPLHSSIPAAFVYRPAGDLASVSSQCPERPYEHRPASGRRCCCQPVDPQEVLSKDQRDAAAL